MNLFTLSDFDIQRIVRALADAPRNRLINQKLDIIMATQTDLDNKLAELETVISAQAQAALDANTRVQAKLDALAAKAPDFQIEVNDIQAEIDAANANLTAIQGIAPADSTPPPTPLTPETPAGTGGGPALDPETLEPITPAPVAQINP